MSKIFHADIRLAPEYFNRVCNATIPESFNIRCANVKHFDTNIEALMDEELNLSGETPELAVKYLIIELKKRGLTGNLRVNHAYRTKHEVKPYVSPLPRSNSAKAHDAYLAEWRAKNPNVVKPTLVSMFTPEYEALTLAWVGAVDTETEGKCLRPSKVFVLTDGRAVESGADSRGNSLYAVFPSLKAAQDYDAPMSYNVYYGYW